MKKLLLTLIVPLVFGGSIFAQNHTSHWADFNSGPFEMWDAIVAFIKIDGTYVTDNWEDFEVASFIDGECRGHAFLRMEEDITYPCVELPVYRMDSIVGEEVSFKLFDHVNGIEYVACTSSIPIITGTDYDDLYLEDYDKAVVLDFAATVTQTIALLAGWNWVSVNVEITLDDLKAALLEAYPGVAINQLVIKGNGLGQTAWNPMANRWIGSLTSMDLSQMYMVKVPSAGEVTLEGMQINPEDHPATIKPGVNWIAFPMSESMSLADAFAGFSANQDVVKGNGLGQAFWNNNAHRWIGVLQTLVPGQGYIYNSKATEPRTFIYPSNMK